MTGGTHRHQPLRYILGGAEPHPPWVPVPKATHILPGQVPKYCCFVGTAPGQPRNRPKFDPYVTDNQRSEYLANQIDMSKWIAIQNRAMGCRDSDDDNFLETALISDADALISGDSVLQVLEQIGSIPILSVAGFLSNFSW